MVYRGKPSAGCYSCRGRRIKCDQKRPECSQCKSISFACPGYRNPMELYFRDENDTVIKKAKASYKASTGKRQSRGKPKQKGESVEWIEPSPEAVSGSPDSATPVLWPSISMPFEDVGVAHFMASYVPGSHFEYLPDLYCQSDFDSPLWTTIYAASTASLSQELGEPSLMASARGWYNKALTMTNDALADGKAALRDSTLVSVLLLSLFEALISNGVAISKNWTAHTRGALALIKLRGEQQFRTELGRQLFIQVGSYIRVSCLQNALRIPPEFHRLWLAAKPFYEEDNPRLALASLLEEVAELRVVIDEGGYTPFEILQRAMELDQRIASLCRTLPPAFQYGVIRNEDHQADIYQSIIHQYPDHHVAQLWNSYRMLRILLNEFIHGYSSLASTNTLEMTKWVQEQAMGNVTQMGVDICASVPQSLRHASSLNIPGTNQIKAHAASFLWPLSAVRGASLAPESARRYAMERLKYLGYELKLGHAVRIAGTSCGEQDALDDGLHIFYLL